MISSVANRTVKAVRRLGKRPWRERQGLLLCEGHRALRSALDGGLAVQQVLYLAHAGARRADLLDRATKTGAETFAVSAAVMRHLIPLESPPDVLSVVVRKDLSLHDQRCEPAVVLLSEVRDPAATGTIAATALAAGCNGLIQGHGTVDPFDRKALRAGGGSQLRLAVVRDAREKDAIEHHRANGAHIVALTPAGGPLPDAALSDRVLFVIEGEGTRDAEGIAALADEQVRAPDGVSVASGSAMLLYEWMRRRGT